jgi:hypothetical protein
MASWLVTIHQYLTATLASEFLDDGLEVNHQVAVFADVLANLVHATRES